MGKVFQLGENHFRTVIYPEAVHYWDAANKVYRSIDNRLVQLSDGLRNAANGKLQVHLKENLVQLANDRQQEISWQLVQGRKVAPKQNAVAGNLRFGSRVILDMRSLQSFADAAVRHRTTAVIGGNELLAEPLLPQSLAP